MESILKLFLLMSVFLFLYNYFIYPFLVIVLSRVFSDSHMDKIDETSDYPMITFIVAAYNEEKVIENKILNTYEIDYPEDKFQFIVVTDGSDDKTPDVVKKYSSKGVVCLHEDKRSGKSAALNRAVKMAEGDVLVFSDANNDFEKEAVKKLVRHFSDSNIGAVTGAKHIYENDSREASKGDGLYWKYESKIKAAESHLGSITAAEGEILAVRKSMFKPIDHNKINDDAAITFDIVKSGARIIYEKEAKAFEQASKNLMDDFHVKVRMASGGYQTMVEEKSYLFPPGNWFAFTFISHKVLRWFTPHLMILVFLLSIALMTKPVIFLFLLLQVVFYSVSFYGWKYRMRDLPGYIYIPMYFSSMNLALFMGFIKFLNKKQGVNWKKVER